MSSLLFKFFWGFFKCWAGGKIS